jgi:hypothetical protein
LFYSSVPTNPKGELDIVELEKVMRHERTATTFVTFLACTDEVAALDYLNNWDHTMDHVDVVDDYRSELAQIQQKQGANIKFTYGDYLIKALIGSIDSTYVFQHLLFYKHSFFFLVVWIN